MPLTSHSHPVRKRRGLVAAALAVCAAVGLSACATDSSTEPAPDGTTALNLSIAPVLFGAPAQHAISSGMLSDAGIEGTIVQATSPAETWPQLMSGDLDLAIMDLQSAILARSEGIPVALHAPVMGSAQVVEGETFGFGTLMVPGDSEVQSLHDLEGRSIGVNSIGNQSWLDVVTVLDREGVDVSKVEFVEIPATRAIPAAQQGQVDAIALGEPFGTEAQDTAGMRSLARVDTGVPGVPAFSWVSTEAFASENPELIASFNEVMLEANAAVNDDPQLAIDAAKEFLPFEPAMLEAAFYPEFSTQPLTLDDVQQVTDRMVSYEVIGADAVPDLEAMLATGS